MTEIEKIRKRKNVGNSLKWFFYIVGMLMMLLTIGMASNPSCQGMAIPFVYCGIFNFFIGYELNNRKIHKELVQEIDTLRRELEEIKATGKQP